MADKKSKLIAFRATLKEDPSDKFTIHFDCMAEDFDHAEEQTLNAYPDANVITITKFSD